MKKILLSITAMLLVQSVSEAAMFEAKLAYSMLTSKVDLGTGMPDSAPSTGLGFDILVMPPLMPIGLGLRQENLGFSVDNSLADVKATSNRTALVINARLLDTLFYVGPVVTYGLSHEANMKIKILGVNTTQKVESISSYSVGLEAGVRLGVLLGAEAGYMSYKGKASGDNVDFSGSYAKVFVGFGF